MIWPPIALAVSTTSFWARSGIRFRAPALADLAAFLLAASSASLAFFDPLPICAAGFTSAVSGVAAVRSALAGVRPADLVELADLAEVLAEVLASDLADFGAFAFLSALVSFALLSGSWAMG